MSNTRQRLFNLKEASIYLGRSVWAVRELIWRGRIPSVRLDRKVQIDIRDLEEMIEKNKTLNTY